MKLPQNLRAYDPDPTTPDAYPIATFTRILLRKNYSDAEQATSIRDLFSWALVEGGALRTITP